MPGTLVSRRVAKDTFDTGAASGTQTITHPLAALDLSHAEGLRLELSVTTADTDAIDTLDVRFQFLSADGICWNTVARFAAITGDQSPSATAPECLVLVLSQVVDLASTEEAYEPSGSAGAAEIAAGTVRNGQFPGINRTSAAGRQATARIRYVVTDADSDGQFAGRLDIFALTRV